MPAALPPRQPLPHPVPMRQRRTTTAAQGLGPAGETEADPIDEGTQRVLHERLQRRERELIAQLLALREERTEPQGASSPDVEDPGDTGERRTRETVRDAEETRDADELRAVQAALRRLAAGDYGSCIDCGLDIGAARLKAQPAAARCLACQQREERQRALLAGPGATAVEG